jgi:hypothetical protein
MKHKEIFHGDGNVYYLGCSDVCMVSEYIQIHKMVYVNCMKLFAYQLFINNQKLAGKSEQRGKLIVINVCTRKRDKFQTIT